jgi:DNA-binding response OmpR family regulator
MNEAARKKVMIVDDDRNFLDLVRDAMSQFPRIKLITHLCFSGYDVIDDINAVSPDILFLDVRLPDCSGVELSRKLSEKKGEIIYPYYFISAWKEEELKDYLTEETAKRFIHKADFIQQLLTVLKAHFGPAVLDK